MGEVWHGTDLALSRAVAVKLLHPEHASRPDGLARFRAEAQHAGSLSHPNIAQVYDYCEPAPPDPAYLVLELVDGPSLARHLDDGPLSPARTLDVIEQAASGLAAAHRSGLLHRDIKPGNLLLSGDGLIKITDFGIARAAGSAVHTRTGALAGTPAYLAPERFGGAPATPATDLYALGVVAHQCLTGQVPFAGDPLVVALAHVERDMPPLPGSVPADLAALVIDLTRKDPQARPASAIAVLARAGLVRASVPAPADAFAGTGPSGTSSAGAKSPATRSTGTNRAGTRFTRTNPAGTRFTRTNPAGTSSVGTSPLRTSFAETSAAGGGAAGDTRAWDTPDGNAPDWNAPDGNTPDGNTPGRYAEAANYGSPADSAGTSWAGPPTATSFTGASATRTNFGEASPAAGDGAEAGYSGAGWDSTATGDDTAAAYCVTAGRGGEAAGWAGEAAGGAGEAAAGVGEAAGGVGEAAGGGGEAAGWAGEAAGGGGESAGVGGRDMPSHRAPAWRPASRTVLVLAGLAAAGLASAVIWLLTSSAGTGPAGHRPASRAPAAQQATPRHSPSAAQVAAAQHGHGQAGHRAQHGHGRGHTQPSPTVTPSTPSAAPTPTEPAASPTPSAPAATPSATISGAAANP